MIINVAKSAMAAVVLAVMVAFTGTAQASPAAAQASALKGAVNQASGSLINKVQFRRGGFRRGGFRGRGFRGRGFRRGGFRGRGFRGRGFRRGGFRRGFRGRRFRRGFGTGFGVGFGTGVFFGSAVAGSSFVGHSDFPVTNGACGKFGIGSDDYNLCCSKKFKSFNPDTGRYLAFSGKYRACK